MFKFILKSGTYFFLIKKFKHEIISILISLLSIFLVFGISNDLVNILQIKDSNTLLYILIGKWVLIVSIVLYTFRLIKSLKKSIKEDEVFEEDNLPKKSQDILNKKDILTTTDLILSKYKSLD